MDSATKAAATDQAVADATLDGAASAVSGPVLATLRKRADFLRAASARRQGMPGFLLQARRRHQDEAGQAIRVGFTCSKKLGNAVTRNRAKRRLRALARAVMPQTAQPGWDYVLVGRPGVTVERGFAEMRADLDAALARVHGQRGERS
ncbi:ribonuclease P protein component [Paracoccus thiocyanatus]|uniref:Ribonuclease P protein component n=1 Tax=Paracoccus thiocyanatus TaxID=34006 RepID=A0A3D8PDD9_9RHOB|nr:ribonuclease P protein component [Paracoccus thiocyanatus]RDW14096.1 ribonuclease P protein component [Paracoccus thiocyanatus]